MTEFIVGLALFILIIALLILQTKYEIPDEEALKKQEEERQNQRLLQRAFSEKFTPGCNDLETLEDFEERYN